MTILQTSRLRLVPYRQGDIDSLYAIMRDRRVMQHIGKGPISRDEVCQLVDRVEKLWKDIGMGWWTIRLKKDDRVIGQICLQPLPELSEIGVGYIWPGAEFLGARLCRRGSKRSASIRLGRQALKKCRGAGQARELSFD